MNFNFFEWIREGVKQSVLMGVSDAVVTMGEPHDNKTAKDKIMNFLQTDSTEETTAKRRISSSSATSPATNNKKLGRSITEIQ